MSVDTFEVSNVGQIAHASVALRDFTVIVGPQASGKSIFLQLFKLAFDHPFVGRELKQYSFDWGDDSSRFWDLYFGEGSKGLIRPESRFVLHGRTVPLSTFLPGKFNLDEHVFYIPAQRVLTMEGGWPKGYREFNLLDPFVVKHFGETLRLMAEREIVAGGRPVFPLGDRFGKSFSDLISSSVYFGAEVNLDKDSPKKRLTIDLDASRIPFMSWSAGQREFTPLLLSMLYLAPVTLAPKDSKVDSSDEGLGEKYPDLTFNKGLLWRDSIRCVVLEEPEMGLHPDAIKVLIAWVLHLHYCKYQVVLSTHSPVILEFFWALKELGLENVSVDSARDGIKSLIRILGLPEFFGEMLLDIAKRNSFGAYFFDRTPEGVVSRDISSLDPSSDEDAVAAWGRLTDFSSKVSEIVSKAHA